MNQDFTLTLLVKNKQQFGQILKSRRGKEYLVSAVGPTGFTLTRRGPKKTKVNISNKLLVRTLKRLFNGEELLPQAAEIHGGISYTVAITVGVVWCLQDFIEEGHNANGKRIYRLRNALTNIDFGLD